MAKRYQRTWQLAKEIRKLKQWLADVDQKTFQWDDARETILSELSTPNDKTANSIRVDLVQVHCWKVAEGIVAVIENSTNRWKYIDLGLRFAVCDVQIAFGNYLDRRLPKRGALSDVEYPLVLAGAIALGHNVFADWFGEILVESYLSGKGAFRDWKWTPLYPFVTELYARWRGIDVSKHLVHRSLDAYSGLLEYWDNPEKLTSSMVDACNYHCSHIKPTERDITEFEKPPYTVFPVEIVAYQRIRHELGMPTLGLDHPILNTPLAHVPEKIVPINDPVLERVVAFIRQQFPSVKF